MKFHPFIFIFIAIVLTAIPVFIKLDVLAIRKFDESRLAISAYEMQKNGDWLVPHFDNTPDLWNTKPPLMIWLQALLMKILGVNEWSVRLPAAVSGFITCLVLLFFSIKHLKEYLFGIITMLILATSHGYMDLHGIRTGDYDALMTLFIVLYSLTLFLFIENNNRKFLYLTFLFISLAVLTKGVAGLLMTPGLALYAILRNKGWSILKNRHFYFGLLMMIALIGWYYLVRESQNPGYFKAVITNELIGRYFESIEQESKGFWHYYHLFRQSLYKEWFLFLLPGLIVGLVTSDKKRRWLVIFSALLVIQYFLVISFSMTKHYWYVLPMYPFLAIILGSGIFNILQWMMQWRFMSKPILKLAIPLVLLIAIFYEPYRVIFNMTNRDQEYAWEKERYHNTYFLKDALHSNRNLDGYTYAALGYQANSWYYIFQLRDRGQEIRISEAKTGVRYSGSVLAFQQEVKDLIKEKYNFEVTETYYNVEIFRIYGEKQGD